MRAPRTSVVLPGASRRGQSFAELPTPSPRPDEERAGVKFWRDTNSCLEIPHRSSRRQEAHSHSGVESQSLLTSAATKALHQRAFTLLELLVVTSIIGLLAVVGLPALKGFGKTNAIATADRQLLNDLGYARQRAIAEHTDVYVLFMFPTNADIFASTFNGTNTLTPAGRQQVTNLLQQQYGSYALFAWRSVGDQPGRRSPRYLTPWRSLPDGIFVAPGKFIRGTKVDGVSSFEQGYFPFPSATNRSISMPYLAFDHMGQLLNPRDGNGSEEIIPLARGSIFYFANLEAEMVETPRSNYLTSSTMYNHIRIDGLTGRARVDKFEMQ